MGSCPRPKRAVSSNDPILIVDNKDAGGVGQSTISLTWLTGKPRSENLSDALAGIRQ
jgi:hypothetical protein